MRWAIVILATISLTGCLGSRIDLSDLSTTAAATVGAGTAVAVGLPTVPVVTVTALSAVAGAALVDEPETSVVDAIDLVPEEERAGVLKAHEMWAAVESLGYWIIVAVLAFFLLPLLVGYILPNGKQRKMQRMMFDNPDIKHKDL